MQTIASKWTTCPLHFIESGLDFQIPEIISIFPNPNALNQISLPFHSIPNHRYRLLDTNNLTENVVEISGLLATGQTETFNLPLVKQEFFNVEDLGAPILE